MKVKVDYSAGGHLLASIIVEDATNVEDAKVKANRRIENYMLNIDLDGAQLETTVLGESLKCQGKSFEDAMLTNPCSELVLTGTRMHDVNKGIIENLKRHELATPVVGDVTEDGRGRVETVNLEKAPPVSAERRGFPYAVRGRPRQTAVTWHGRVVGFMPILPEDELRDGGMISRSVDANHWVGFILAAHYGGQSWTADAQCVKSDLLKVAGFKKHVS